MLEGTSQFTQLSIESDDRQSRLGCWCVLSTRSPRVLYVLERSDSTVKPVDIDTSTLYPSVPIILDRVALHERGDGESDPLQRHKDHHCPYRYP